MKSFLKSAFIFAVKTLISLFGKRNKARIKRLLSSSLGLINVSDEQVFLKDGNTLTFHCLNDLTRWRVQTFFEKEPETLEWIDSFEKNDIFWDIGANMGLYTVYAASRGARVLAFEPSGANFYVLNMSILKNNFSDVATAYCIAFNDQERLGNLLMKNFEFGGALSSFDSTVGFDGKNFIPHVKQGMIGYSIDRYISLFKPSFPNHIKIDVDGIEDKIVAGAPLTLADRRLKSLSIELDANRPKYTQAVISNIEQAGLRFESKRHAEIFDNSPYAGIYNYLFIRN
jgi:FkbM family methyltransferase